jgi:hypothetical protein
MDKFKTIAFVIVAAFAVILVGGFIVLEVTGRPTSTFLLFGTTVLGNLAVFGGLGYAQTKQGEKLDRIQGQTNGTLSRLREDNVRLQAALLEKHGVDLALESPHVEAPKPEDRTFLA